tara:strand:- start:1011 stop:1430 length:420 start_codon:yes stop_codon:yes gene_type:complete
MKSSDMFYATSAIILLISMAYFSVQTEVIEKISTVVKWEDSVVIIDTVEVVETEIDTIFEYKTYRDDIVMNGQSIIMNKRYLFHLSEDTMIGNQIRDIMPFGEVFNYWRDILGPCGVFDWKGDTYITLYKEEELQLCQQ